MQEKLCWDGVIESKQREDLSSTQSIAWRNEHGGVQVRKHYENGIIAHKYRAEWPLSYTTADSCLISILTTLPQPRPSQPRSPPPPLQVRPSQQHPISGGTPAGPISSLSPIHQGLAFPP